MCHVGLTELNFAPLSFSRGSLDLSGGGAVFEKWFSEMKQGTAIALTSFAHGPHGGIIRSSQLQVSKVVSESGA